MMVEMGERRLVVGNGSPSPPETQFSTVSFSGKYIVHHLSSSSPIGFTLPTTPQFEGFVFISPELGSMEMALSYAGCYSNTPFSTSRFLPLQGRSFTSLRSQSQRQLNHLSGISFLSKRGFRLRKSPSNLQIFCFRDPKGAIYLKSKSGHYTNKSTRLKGVETGVDVCH